MNQQLKSNNKPRKPDFLDLFGAAEAFPVASTPINTMSTCTITGPVESVEQFEALVETLDNAKEGDIVEIRISTEGGALFAIIPLLAAMENTEALVYAHAISDVSSAGTFILLNADEAYVNPFATVMMHNISFGSGGTGSSVESHVNHTIKASKQLINEIYKGFFTQDEIDHLLNGRDYYLDKSQFDERYKARAEARQALAQQRFKEMQEEADAATAPKKPRKPKLVKVADE